MPPSSVLRSLSFFLALVSASVAAPDSVVRSLGVYRGVGAVFASTVAGSPSGSSERLYVAHTYAGNTVDVVSIDVTSRATRTYPNPAPTEHGIRAMVTGPDGNIYMGTFPNAHLFKLDTEADRLLDLGEAIRGESFIWDLAFGPDRRLYAGTQPGARLARYDPATGTVEDLGRVDPDALFVRYVAISDDGFVYAGVGPRKANVVAIRPTDQERRPVLPPSAQVGGTAQVWRAADGKVYAKVGDQHFSLQEFSATPIERSAAPTRVWSGRMRDGRYASVRGNRFRVTTSQSRQSDDHAYDYAGRELPVFRVGIGPDGRLYGSSAMPARLLRFDDAKGAFEELGELGDGEVYFFLRDRDRLLMAGYAVHAPLMSFDPRRPFRRGDPDGNPLLVRWPAVDESWRTFAAVIGADARSFWGGLAGYGKLGGPLVAWQPETGSVEVFSVGRDQSVSALGVWKDKLIVGTTILGGMGSTPTQQSARLILWDPKTGSAVFDVEVPRAVSVENAITGPDGLVYAIADRKLLVFDVAARKFVTTRPLPFSGGSVYGSLGVGPDGRIWGLAPAVPGIFVIDPRTREVRLKATVPKPITGGFAIRGRQLYFTCGGELFSYELPGPR